MVDEKEIDVRREKIEGMRNLEIELGDQLQ
jgi:hypothetical protein